MLWSAQSILPLILFCCASLASTVRFKEEDVQVKEPTIRWHQSERCQEVKEFAPDPAVLKINLDLSKVWSALSGEALLAIQGIENMSWSMNLEIRKSVGFEEIELAVTSKTLLTGDLRGVVMSMPGIPTTAFRNVSFKAKAKDPRLPLLSLSAKVLKENGRNVLKFPKEDRDVNLQLEDLKVRGNGTYWSGTVARLTNLFSRVGAVNIKAQSP